MFSFFRKGVSPKSLLAIQQALVKQGLPFDMSVNRVGVLTRQGNYAGRSVRYFRAFDADQAAHGGVAIRKFHELDARPDLVIGSGHVEHDGGVVLTRRDPALRKP
jgi:hypothetical protein